jgi:hypothetical protein
VTVSDWGRPPGPHNHHDAHHTWQQALTILNDLNHPDADQLPTKLATLGGDGQQSW